MSGFNANSLKKPELEQNITLGKFYSIRFNLNFINFFFVFFFWSGFSNFSLAPYALRATNRWHMFVIPLLFDIYVHIYILVPSWNYVIDLFTYVASGLVVLIDWFMVSFSVLFSNNSEKLNPMLSLHGSHIIAHRWVIQYISHIYTLNA